MCDHNAFFIRIDRRDDVFCDLSLRVESSGRRVQVAFVVECKHVRFLIPPCFFGIGHEPMRCVGRELGKRGDIAPAERRPCLRAVADLVFQWRTTPDKSVLAVEQDGIRCRPFGFGARYEFDAGFEQDFLQYR